MLKNVVGVLKYMALAVAVVGVMAAPAKADIVYEADFFLDAPLGSPAEEEAFLENILGPLDFLAKWDADTQTCVGGSCNFIDVDFNGAEADVSWDLTGTDTELTAALLKDGVVDGDHLYTLWLVTDDQAVVGGGSVHFGPPGNTINKGISHISFFGGAGEPPNGVPEPTTLVLLGAGLLGTALLRRRAK